MMVPHFYQTSEQTCGAACLRMLFAALGFFFDEAIVAKECSTTPLGCTVQDLIQRASSLGLTGEMLRVSSESEAINALCTLTPFVAMIDAAVLQRRGPAFQWHFVVALNGSSSEVTFHDPADGPDRRAGLEDFLTAWGMLGYRGVRVWIP
jgi:ABC-type bacteriocin/lantibiotic exporter with double-glycine peptidase domain